MGFHNRHFSYSHLLLIFFISLNIWLLENPSAWAYSDEDLTKLLNTNNCPKCDLSGINLRRVDLNGANLEGANLERAILFDVDLIKANLRGANLKYTELKKSNFQRAQLQSANLQYAEITRTDFERSNLQNADFRGTHFSRVRFVAITNFENSRFAGSMLQDLVFDGESQKFAEYIESTSKEPYEEKIEESS